ncbi:MAG: radical SAM protein [Calditrichaeota bacterium]|nr:MAG: radical SAM protein [Calditrichota bacterium]
MRRLRIGIVDLVTHSSSSSIWARVMNANFAAIMPQAVAAWCQQEGHQVDYMCFTGFEKLPDDLPQNCDLVFICAFSQAAQLAYSLSHFYHTQGAATALGGPHARCYPQDAVKYFDYVFGFTDQTVVRDVLQDCARQYPVGVYVSASQQPTALPSVRERWSFIQLALEKAARYQVVNMLGSLGCPYTCSFCIDSVVAFQPMDFDTMKEDLRFLLTKFKRPRVGWHDPNFGVRFNDYLDMIEEAVPPNSIDFYAESSLALLSEPNLKRLQRNGFKVIMPGIESWYDMGNKSKSGKKGGMEKVRQVAEHINLVMSYIPYLQANFVFGLDSDEGPDPFECTKRFVDLAPGAYPAYCLLSAFGQAAPLNLTYQRENRVLPVPFHFLNTQHAMNVKPKNYTWSEFFGYMVDLNRYTFSWRAVRNRYKAIRPSLWRWLNVLRGRSAQGIGRARYYGMLRNRLETDKELRAFFEQETTKLPQFYVEWIKRDLGPMWEWLPEGALQHDPNAYLHAQEVSEQPADADSAS